MNNFAFSKIEDMFANLYKILFIYGLPSCERIVRLKEVTGLAELCVERLNR